MIESEINSEKKDAYIINGELIPGQVDMRYFRLLISISSISNHRIRSALEDVLVHGETRKNSCAKYGINQGYFSVKFNYLQFVNQTVFRMYYFLKQDC